MTCSLSDREVFTAPTAVRKREVRRLTVDVCATGLEACQAACLRLPVSP